MSAPVILDFQLGTIRPIATIDVCCESIAAATIYSGPCSYQTVVEQTVWQTVAGNVYLQGSIRGPIMLDFQSRTICPTASIEMVQGHHFNTSRSNFVERTSSTSKSETCSSNNNYATTKQFSSGQESV